MTSLCVEHSRGIFWEWEENNSNPSKSWFSHKASEVKVQETHFLGIKCQDGSCQYSMEVINNIIAMASQNTKKKKTKTKKQKNQTNKQKKPNMLYTATEENSPTWSLWQKAPGKTRGWPEGFWIQRYSISKAVIFLLKNDIGTYEGVWAASKGVGAEAQLLLALFLCWAGPSKGVPLHTSCNW